jgi:hypothetical protein
MSPENATWGLLIVSVFGVWLTGQRPIWGWRFALVNQILVWLPWAIWAQQPGLIAQGILFTLIYARNLYRWRHGTMTPQSPEANTEPMPRQASTSPEKALV